jgi:hypothetical protein
MFSHLDRLLFTSPDDALSSKAIKKLLSVGRY